jgi:hypothetical protein
MIVEVIGLPSVGKSSILSNLSHYHSQDKIRLMKSTKCKLWARIISILKFILGLLFYYPNIILNIKSSKWLLYKISYRLCNYKNDIHGEFCILNDAGILMPIISFIVQRNECLYEVDLNKIISVLPLPDIVVFIESDVNAIVDRYVSRGGLKINGERDIVIKNNKLYSRFLLGHNTLLELKNILKKNGCIVVTINNDSVDKYNEMPSIFIKKLVSKFNLI